MQSKKGFAPQNEPYTAILCFSALETFSPEIDKKNPLISVHGPQRLSENVDRNNSGRTFFPKESETDHILWKTVLNFKMSHIGQFIAILVF